MSTFSSIKPCCNLLHLDRVYFLFKYKHDKAEMTAFWLCREVTMVTVIMVISSLLVKRARGYRMLHLKSSQQSRDCFVRTDQMHPFV